MSHVRPCSSLLAAGVLAGLTACNSQSPLRDADLVGLGAVAQEVDGARLMSLVSDLATEHRLDTKHDCTGLESQRLPGLCFLSNARAGALVRDHLSSGPLQVQQQEITSGQFTTTNIIAELPGTTLPQEVVLIGAHYDAFYSGADDNSSGMAAVLEMARVLSSHRFERTLRFVAFDLEEFGFIGSHRYIDSKAGEQVVTALILDAVGYYSLAPDSQGSLPGLPAPSTADFISAIADDPSTPRLVELSAINAALRLTKVFPMTTPRDGTSPALGDLLRSDHSAFWFAGKQALFLTDTANFRNPNYHQESDTPDTLHPELFRQTVQLSAAAAAYWAGGPK